MTNRELLELAKEALNPAAEAGNLWAGVWLMRLDSAGRGTEENLASELDALKESISSMIDSLAPVLALVTDMLGGTDAG